MSSSSSTRISISSDEVNMLIYRYLIEAGFKHTAFVFHGESLLQRSPNLVNADMPPGALVSLMQKALLFLYVESHISNDGKQIPCDEAFSLFKPHDHDHGPIEAPVQFEPGYIEGIATLKRSEVSEDVSRPPKKSKPQTARRLEEAAEDAASPNPDNVEGGEVTEKIEVPQISVPEEQVEPSSSPIDSDEKTKADSDKEMVDDKAHQTIEN